MNKTLVLNTFLYLSLLLGSSCTDDGKLEGCDPPLTDVTLYSNKTGILTLSDSTPGHKLSNYSYFLYSDERPYVPLQVCNTTEISNLVEQGKKIEVTFSGNMYVIPDDISVYWIPFELTHIKLTNLNTLKK